MATRKSKATQVVAVLQGYVPLRDLWTGDGAPYPSEWSARWHLRCLRTDLAAARAVAKFRNSIYVHPTRFAEVVERAALDRYAMREVQHG